MSAGTPTPEELERFGKYLDVCEFLRFHARCDVCGWRIREHVTDKTIDPCPACAKVCAITADAMKRLLRAFPQNPPRSGKDVA